MSLPAETTAFFLSGLVHQFGNLLLTIQGNAMGIGTATPAKVRGVILGAVDRGAASLEVLRVLLGLRTAGVQAAGPLLANILELSRIPLRERGWTMRSPADAHSTTASVAIGPFVRATASGIRWLATMVPEGTPGVVEVRLGAQGAGSCTLRLSFETGAGSLPFPLPLGDIVAALTREVPRGVRVRTEPGANAFELSFEVAAGGILPSSAGEA